MDVMQARRDLALSRELHDYTDRINVLRPGDYPGHAVSTLRWVADHIAHMAGAALAAHDASQQKGL